MCIKNMPPPRLQVQLATVLLHLAASMGDDMDIAEPDQVDKQDDEGNKQE